MNWALAFGSRLLAISALGEAPQVVVRAEWELLAGAPGVSILVQTALQGEERSVEDPAKEAPRGSDRHRGTLY